MLIDLQSRAEEDLSFIRQAMARAERVSAVSGTAMMGMGILAMMIAALANLGNGLESQLKFWLAIAPVAAVVGILGTVLKARRRAEQSLKDPFNRFLLCLVPPISIAIVFTEALWGSPYTYLMPSLWMLCYGCGLVAAGTYTVKPVVYMGVGFLVMGVISTMLSDGWLNPAMAASFGGLHMFFGWRVSKHHGG